MDDDMPTDTHEEEPMQTQSQTEERCLVLVKEGHRYVFKYRLGQEVALFYTLMEYATDDRFNVSVKDLVHCTSRILKSLQPEAVIDLG